MAIDGFLRRVRRWRRKRLEQPPSPLAARMSTIGITLLLAGAALIAIYVARLR